MKSQDKQFAAATIQAIGRCATNISEVTDTCLNGLVCLLSNRDGKLNIPSGGWLETFSEWKSLRVDNVITCMETCIKFDSYGWIKIVASLFPG